MRHSTWTQGLLCAVLCMLSLTGCEKTPTPSDEKGRLLTITVGLPEEDNDTRVAYEDAKLHLKWDNGDILVACGFDDKGHFLASTEFKLSGGAGTSTGTFEGTTVPNAVRYIVYYKNGNLHLNDGIAHPVYTKQDITGTSDATSKIHNYFLLRSHSADGESITASAFESGSFTMKMVSSLLRFDLAIPDDLQDTNVSTLVWTANKGHQNSEKSITLTMTPHGNAKTLTRFICFEDMDLVPSGTFSVKISDKDGRAYVFETVSDQGKKYLPGGRSVATIGKDNWKLITPLQ